MSSNARRTITRLGQAVLGGTLSSEEAVRICLERIEKQDSTTRSFVSLNSQQALAEARARDREPQRGLLHGLPFAVKDIFDTVDLPTEFNSPFYKGFQPAKDAAAVALLRAAGAVFLGKVSTVEFASVGALPETRNPHNADFTPGGSSAGSGAAVGGGEVPLALATQTGGSTIRPASFCGAAAFKPTWGRVPVEGMKPFAPSLDTVGWIAEDCELLARAAEVSGIRAEQAGKVDRALRIGFYKTPYFSEAEQESVVALEETIRLLQSAGHAVEDVTGPPGATALNDWQNTLMHGEGRASYLAEHARDPELLHPGVLDVVNNQLGISHRDMTEAYDRISELRPKFDAAMEGYDAWLTPAVPGEPPRFERGNGLATFNRLFTALHQPCLTLPGFNGPYGLPVGIQLVAPRFADRALLETAQLIEQLIQDARKPASGTRLH
jgi:Asp-tRNA(Asn)/Glu-tRNA(Gln) amidotransferase A subunit family amidase